VHMEGSNSSHASVTPIRGVIWPGVQLLFDPSRYCMKPRLRVELYNNASHRPHLCLPHLV